MDLSNISLNTLLSLAKIELDYNYRPNPFRNYFLREYLYQLVVLKGVDPSNFEPVLLLFVYDDESEEFAEETFLAGLNQLSLNLPDDLDAILTFFEYKFSDSTRDKNRIIDKMHSLSLVRYYLEEYKEKLSHKLPNKLEEKIDEILHRIVVIGCYSDDLEEWNVNTWDCTIEDIYDKIYSEFCNILNKVVALKKSQGY